MTDRHALGGTYPLAGTGITLARMGYGAMQLPGPHVWGPPKDHDAAIAVLRETRALGIDHIDTADFYGPHVSNDLIREALHPYTDGLTIVSKIGALRGDDGSWNPAQSAAELEQAVTSNLEHLGIKALDIVNLRLMGSDDDLEAPLKAILDLQRQGLVRHIGLSNVSADAYRRGAGMAEIVCVQNEYNLAHRGDDALIDALAEAGVAYVPYFPLGGFSPLQSATLTEVATGLGATPLQTALAWLLRRAPNILLIPGTSSVAHLRENVAAATLDLPADALARLDTIGAP